VLDVIEHGNGGLVEVGDPTARHLGEDVSSLYISHQSLCHLLSRGMNNHLRHLINLLSFT
jgi:hypothetical protein